MKRTRLRRRARVGLAARRRVRAGGVLAKGRDSATKDQYAEIVTAIKARAYGLCEVVVGGKRCPRAGCDPCHAWNRSQGCPDSVDTIYWGCRAHNHQQAAAYVDGRLIVTALGGQRFKFDVMYAADKWEARRQ